MFTRNNLLIKPKRFVPRAVFWLLFALITIIFLGGGFVYLDRNVWHNDFADILPAYTEFLLILPANSSDISLRKTQELFAFVPASQQFTPALEPWQFLSSLPQFGPFYEFWRNNQDNWESKLKIASVDGDVVVDVALKDFTFLKNITRLDEIYLDTEIFGLTGQDGGFFVWLRENNLVLSTNKELIKNLINNKRARQFSYWGEKEDGGATEFLSESENYRSALAELPSDFLAAAYVNIESSDTEFYILETVKNFFAFRPASVSPALNPAKSRPWFFAAKPEIDGYTTIIMALPTETELNNKVAWDILMHNFPQRLLDTEIKLVAQIPSSPFFNFPSDPLSFFNQKPWNDFMPFEGLSMQSVVESWERYESGALLLVGTSAGGRPEIFIVTAHTNKTEAENLGKDLAEEFRRFSAEADYLYTKNYLFVGTNRAALDELAAVWGSVRVSFGQEYEVNFPNDSLAVIFIDTNFLSQYARFVLGQKQSSVLAALEAMTSALPRAQSWFVSRGRMVVQKNFFKINPVSPAQKGMVERYLHLLQARGTNNSNNTPAIRDAGRLADATILETAMRQFTANQGRAPISLAELIPTYLSALPTDPQSGEVYEFSNLNKDKSFFVSFIFEDGGQLNGPGRYCLTSLGLEYADGGGCVEK